MNKHAIKGIVFVIIVFLGVYIYLKPFTQSQVYTTVDTYFDTIQDLKQDSLLLMTTAEQSSKDKESLYYITTQYGGNFEFTNRYIKITENTFTSAKVYVSTVVKKTANNITQTVPTVYELELKKALNIKGDKVWLVTNRQEVKN